jgi:hypothetical protein
LKKNVAANAAVLNRYRNFISTLAEQHVARMGIARSVNRAGTRPNENGSAAIVKNGSAAIVKNANDQHGGLVPPFLET